jgi:hypothetical protein
LLARLELDHFGVDRGELVEGFDLGVVFGGMPSIIDGIRVEATPINELALADAQPIVATSDGSGNFSIIVPGTNGSVRSRVKLAPGLRRKP